MIRIAIAALALSTLATAQVATFGDNDARACTTKWVLDQGQGYKLLGSASIQYGSPVWKAEYDKAAEMLKGKSERLGKGFWTTLNNSVALTIGTTKVPAGSYYLSIHCDDKGNFHLLVIDSKTADTKSWTPWSKTEWKADYTCALTHGKGTKTVDNLSITLNGDDAAKMDLKLAWGGHELTAPVQMHTGTMMDKAKDAAVKGTEKAGTEAVETKKVPETVKKN